MKRAAIYARYSSDRQNERSIADQVNLCKSFAARNGWIIAEIYSDEAVSGSSEHGRMGFARMLNDARARKFSIILAEDMDRLTRSASLAPKLYEDMEFLGIEIQTVGDGKITSMHASLKGFMGAQFLANLALHTRRGMAGRIAQGFAAGGIGYGYRAVKQIGADGEPIRGLREIDETQAAIVRRIFAEYVTENSVRKIARSLNADDIPPPRGGHSWTQSTLNGNPKRGNGILSNALYDGRLVWNKVSMKRDPATGSRVSRPNPKDQWQEVTVPHLRIVDPDIFARAQAIKDARQHMPRRIAQPRVHLLSGLIRCGICGAAMLVKDSSKHGRRLYCSRMRQGGKCSNGTAPKLRPIEARVIDSLRVQLQNPAAIEAFIESYIEERRRLAKERDRRQVQIDRRIGEIARAIERGVQALLKGHAPDREIGPVIMRMSEEKAALEHERDTATKPIDAPTLHPAALKRYTDTIDNLAKMLPLYARDSNGEVSGALRELIETVTVTPRPNAEPAIEITGKLAALMGTDIFPQGRAVVSRVVAGAVIHQTATRIHPRPPEWRWAA